MKHIDDAVYLVLSKFYPVKMAKSTYITLT